MNAEHSTSASTAAAYGSPGAAIRSARTRAGLSIDELASRTRLARPTLEAMENDAFDQLLEPVYVRGYYRKCARILDLPEQPLIDSYEALYTPPPKIAPARLRLASGGDLGSAPRFVGRLPILAPIAAVVIISLIWLWRQSTAPTALQTVSLIEPSITASDTMPPLEGPAGALTAPAAVPGDSAAVIAPVESTAVAAPVPVGTQLVLEFSAISWARVEDAAGKPLLSGVISAGERMQLDGQPPYSIFLGNAPGVKLQFGGLAVDLAPHTKSNSTARFSVPAAGG